MPDILGLHHVTAIASDPQKNIDFYAGVLGLRLVKLTVNYDDPTTPLLRRRAGTSRNDYDFFPMARRDVRAHWDGTAYGYVFSRARKIPILLEAAAGEIRDARSGSQIGI